VDKKYAHLESNIPEVNEHVSSICFFICTLRTVVLAGALLRMAGGFLGFTTRGTQDGGHSLGKIEGTAPIFNFGRCSRTFSIQE